MSHFRFQEELEWEDDASSGDGAQHDPVASRFLNLDLADLSSSMSCIPLHQLLGIDQSLFPADQLESHMKSVGEKRCVYFDSKNDKNDNLLPKRGKEESKTRTGENSKELCESVSNDVNIASSTCSHESNHIESGLKKHKADEATASSNNLSAQELKIQQASLAHVDAAKQSHSETSLGLEDDELDQLLDMDVRQEDKTDKTESSSDLNSISNGKAAPPSAKKDEKDQADELEDWLDSILD